MFCLIEGIDLIWVWLFIVVNVWIVILIVCVKFGEFIVLVMFSDFRLYEMFLFILVYDKFLLNNDGVDICRIFEYRLLCVILLLIGLV